MRPTLKTVNMLCFILAIGHLPLIAQNGELGDLEYQEAMDSLALEKIEDLGRYIGIIGSKSTSYSEARRTVDRALQLFVKGSQIGVSSAKSGETEYFPIEEYFERLMMLNYDKVNVKWYDIHYISEPKRLPGGNYVGVVTVFQRFEGRNGDRIIYKDTTKKDITVYIEEKQIQIEGDQVNFWDILLGDIVVAETI